MVKDSLVGIDVELGTRVLEALDAAGFAVPAALWVRWGEEHKWHLLLATPLYDRLGPGNAYRRLVDALWKVDYDWVRSPIRLESTRKPFVRALRQLYGKAADLPGMRLGGQMIGDTWIDEAYIYRVK